MLKKKGDDEERCPDCTVSASGHCGEIDLKPGSYQVLYLQSPAATLPTIFGARQYVTIHNDGPGEMRVWIDTLPSQSVQLGGGLAGP
jgi:hypothetical protein